MTQTVRTADGGVIRVDARPPKRAKKQSQEVRNG